MIQLDQKYNREAFLVFLSGDFLSDFIQDIRPVSLESRRAIHKANSLGASKELDLHIFEFEYSGSAKKRISLTKEAFQIMKQYASFRALAVFHSTDSDDWRLSLLTATPQITEKGGVAQTYSNPKRFSFFLGPNAKVNTPTKYLMKDGVVEGLDDLKGRFSLEVVNKEFYKEISQLFTKLVGGSIKKGKTEQKFETLLKLPSNPERSQIHLEFAVRLIGRIIFCWFLREKTSPAGVSLMPKELLSREALETRSDYYHNTLEPVFFEVLNRPARSRIEDFSSGLFSTVPYLNGGLFSPLEDDFYKRLKGDLQSRFHNTLIIPDDWFKELFEILETYNFTIDENTSYDEELSIDPEMLGRIFENLLAEINPETGESARKSTGSYYTPRVIVDYMVDESLTLHLQTKTNISEAKLRPLVSYDLDDDATHPLTEEDKEKITKALAEVKILDPACGSGAFPMGALQKIVFILQQVDPEGKLWLKKQLVGTSPEMKRLIEREFAHKNFDYLRKLGVIRENIYGVDIQPIATEISRLRCFLTLVVDQRVDDESENRGIEPLPNLDFKFVTANSLIELPKEDQDVGKEGMRRGFDFEDREGIEELRETREMFFNAFGPERDQLKLQFVQTQNKMFQKLIAQGGKSYAALTEKLTSWDPFSHKASSWFDPEWMFGIVGGFDIVIANPPFIGQSGNRKLFQEMLLSDFGQIFHQRRMDYFYFFFHKAILFSKPNGMISFITTNYYLNATYADKLRKNLYDNCNYIRLINFNEAKIFKSASGQHNAITILKKDKSKSTSVETAITKHKGIIDGKIISEILYGYDPETQYFKFKSSDIFEFPKYQILIEGKGEDNPDNLRGVLLNSIKSKGTPLIEVADITQGIVSGANDLSVKYRKEFNINKHVGSGIFVLQKDEIYSMNLNQKEKQFIKPWYKNSDISRWICNEKTVQYLIYMTSKDNIDEKEIPNLVEHFEFYKTLLINRNVRTGRYSLNDYENFLQDKGDIPYVMIKSSFKKGKYYLVSYAREKYVFESPKIVCPQRSPINTFGYTEQPWYGASDVYYIVEKSNLNISLKYLLALLNSKLIFFWLYNKGQRKGETLQLFKDPLSDIPIRMVESETQTQFEVIVAKILAVTKSDDYSESHAKKEEVKEYEKQIDQMVYKLYDLTPEEIDIVEAESRK